MNRLEVSSNNEIPIQRVFETFKFENIEGSVESEVENNNINTIENFSRHLRSLFTSAKFHRLLRNGKKFTIVSGLRIKDATSVADDVSDFEILCNEVPPNVQLVKRDDSCITCSMETNVKCNGHYVEKVMEFCKDGNWNLYVACKQIDLGHLGIDSTYQMTKDNIKIIFNIVEKLDLCDGVKISGSLLCSRFHTVEDIARSSQEKGNNTYRTIRSMSCTKVINITSKIRTCRVCQRMTFANNGKSQNQILKEQQTSDSNRTVTEDDFRKLIPNAPSEMIRLLMVQSQNLKRSPNGRRWTKEIISICLQLYNRTPLGYDALRNSNILLLPSPSLLLLYKNSCKQKIGFHDDIFKWMHKEAFRLDVPEEGYFGGIILDEMSIQEDLQIEKNSNGVELIGLVDKGDESNICTTLRQGEKVGKLGNHVLQLVFLGMTGFRFPFAHFVTDQVQGYELHTLFWEAVDKLQMYGFHCCFTSMDGAVCNRSFLQINTKEDTTLVQSPCNFEQKVAFMMDYSHVMKKIRNNIIKSGITKGCTRNLCLTTGEHIQWQMFIDCFHWDENNALTVHRRLTNEHLYPSTQSKMRNHLAEEILNADMLHLFETFQDTLSSEGACINGPIKLLQQTSKMVKIFRDTRPIRSINDSRLIELQEVVSWFKEWRGGVPNNRCLLSYQCMDDIQYCISGFIELCTMLLKRTDMQIIITPSMINSDVVENIFCQQRATFNGANTNPNALQYRKNINSIILGQSTISKKANTSISSKTPQPYLFSKAGALKRKVKENPCASTETKKIKVIRF